MKKARMLDINAMKLIAMDGLIPERKFTSIPQMLCLPKYRGMKREQLEEVFWEGWPENGSIFVTDENMNNACLLVDIEAFNRWFDYSETRLAKRYREKLLKKAKPLKKSQPQKPGLCLVKG